MDSSSWISLVLSFSKKFVNIRISSIDTILSNTATEKGKEPGSIVITSSGARYEVDEAFSTIISHIIKEEELL